MAYSNPIPDMTDPMGRHWCQPKKENLLVTDKFAVMDEDDFKKLPEYSTTYPSGVYPGKMWKAHVQGVWYLRWYSRCPEAPDTHCNNNQRKIMVV